MGKWEWGMRKSEFGLRPFGAIRAYAPEGRRRLESVDI
jgi:hypothetical protein